MAIMGITNTNESYPRLGKIKKGEKDPVSGKMRDLSYFRIMWEKAATKEKAEFERVYGMTPSRINMRLAFSDVSRSWDAYWVCYVQGGKIAQATEDEKGLRWVWYRDPDTLDVLVRNELPTCPEGLEFIQKKFTLNDSIYTTKNKDGEKVEHYLEAEGRLNIVVPELAKLGVGYMEFCPGGFGDCRNISGELASYAKAAERLGKEITGIPMALTRREEEQTVRINGKLCRKVMWMVHVEIAGNWGEKALQVMDRLSLPDYVVDGQVMEEWDEYHEPEPPQLQSGLREEVSVGENGERISTPITEPSTNRPWSPDVLKAKISEAAELLVVGAKKRNQQITVGDNDHKVLANVIDAIFGDKGVSRHIVCSWLVGTGSTKEMAPEIIKALFHIMGIKEPKFDSAPSQISIDEFRQAYTAAQKNN